jgi:C-terminal processing protease CtpA/Prc
MNLTLDERTKIFDKVYLTWQGRMLENDGITPVVPVDLSRDALREGKDTQLERAIDVVKSM